MAATTQARLLVWTFAWVSYLPPVRFSLNYRKAGGFIETLYIDQETKVGMPSHGPTADFFHRYLG